MKQRQKSVSSKPAPIKRPIGNARLKALIAKMSPLEREQLIERVITRRQVEQPLQTQKAKSEGEQRAKLPKGFYPAAINFLAGKAKRTPEQFINRICTRQDIISAPPEDLQSWYTKFYGEFSEPQFSDLLACAICCILGNDELLGKCIGEAIRTGDILKLERFTRCVAMIHGKPHSGSRHAQRMAKETALNIFLTFDRLFIRTGSRPSASEIRVAMAVDPCPIEAGAYRPKFSDIWLLLRSGPKGDTDDAPGHSSRYEITGQKNIKKTLKAHGLKEGPPLRGRMTQKKLKAILDKWNLRYVDDSKTGTEIFK